MTCALFNPFGGDWLHVSTSARTLSEEHDVADSIDTSVELLSGDTFNGSLGFDGDSDWFKVELQAGSTYRFTMTPGTMLDPYIYIADTNGGIFKEIDWGLDGDAETFVFYASETRTVYVIADSFYNSDNYDDNLVEGDEVITDTGTYTLTISGGETRIEESDVADSTDTSVELFSGDTFNGSLGFDGDSDWFKVELQEGLTYRFTMTPGTMLDPHIYIADINGDIFDEMDFGTTGEAETLEFTSLYPQAVYVIADSYYNSDDYDDNLVEGNEVITDTGTYTLTISAEAFSGTPLDAIAGDYEAPSVINVYFVPGELSFEDFWGQQTSGAWDTFEQQQAMLAFDTLEAVANISFNIVDDPLEANFFMIETNDFSDGLYSGYAAVGGGSMTLDGTNYDLDGWNVLVNSNWSWNERGLLQGGFGFATIIHEIGHALGLAHPHDNGFGSSKMLRVYDSNDYGEFYLNQGINTMMSYLHGWQLAPFFDPNRDQHIGREATPMAFDIAVLQEKYGANTNTNVGDTIYDLPDSNAAGAFYSCIWDAGGTDTIRHNGNAAAVIDLRPASLAYEWNGGGFVCYVSEICGGFTIAANVVIENAKGGSGNDEITGNSFNNVLEGGAGDDVLIGGAGDDFLIGGAGDDTYVIHDVGDVVIENARKGSDLVASWVSYNLGANVENLTLIDGVAIDGTGNTRDNEITGNTDANSLSGGGGNDTLDGGDGDDTLSGGSGRDTLLAGDGNDTLDGGLGKDALTGGAGNDTLDGGAGNDTLTGGEGSDTASYASATAAVTLSLAITKTQNTNGAGTDKLSTIENLTGSSFNDVLTGSTAANVITGGAGNDVINGGGGIDTLDGGEGSDVYLVTLLADKTAAEITDTGNTGTDELRFAATTASTLTLLAGDTGLESVVIGTGTGATAVVKAKTALNVDATSSSNGLSITGNAGANTLTGSGFADTLDGGAGNDVLVGSIGADTLIGGLGRDTLTGGVGADIFKFSLVGDSGTTATASDVITDFVRGEDKIDLSAIDAFLASKNVNDTFIWQGTEAFSNRTQGEVRYQKFDVAETANDHTMIWIDSDKDTRVEMAIRLTGLYDLTANDFIL
jgi:Ca2+-binding RTX toxin-like protein